MYEDIEANLDAYLNSDILLALSGNKALSTNSSINNLENLEVLPADYSQMEAIKRAKMVNHLFYKVLQAVVRVKQLLI